MYTTIGFIISGIVAGMVTFVWLSWVYRLTASRIVFLLLYFLPWLIIALIVLLDKIFAHSMLDWLIGLAPGALVGTGFFWGKTVDKAKPKT